MFHKADVRFEFLSLVRLKTHLTSHPPLDVLSPEEYGMVRAEYKQSQIQAKKEKTDIPANEDERPPGEAEPADGGKDSVNSFHLC